MKLMRRNIRKIWYCLYKGEEILTNTDGLDTGEKKIIYSEPVEIYCNVSPATGYTQTYMFGTLESYDKIIIVDDIKCQIDENSILFIDKKPEKSGSGDAQYFIFDYIVRRVAKSLNHISYAVRKVKVS